MRKALPAIVIVLIFLGIGAYITIPKVIYKMVTEFEPYTFERVLGDTALIADYQIGAYRSPVDYGYDDTEEVTFMSTDSVLLSAWFVPCRKQTDSTLFLIHGRTSNRLKTMKYLQLFKETGIDTLYNFFIADFRNSGKSTTGVSTYMGYKFAEDLAAGLKYLKEQKQQEEFTLYGFSMGAMAIYTFIGRDDLNAESFDIDRIIIDSPLSNVDANLMLRGNELGLPDFLVERGVRRLADATDGFSTQMYMSNLMKGSEIPLLLIQSNHDISTPASFTREELNKLNSPHITSWFMDSAAHVKLYTNPNYREKYTKLVSEFLR